MVDARSHPPQEQGGGELPPRSLWLGATRSRCKWESEHAGMWVQMIGDRLCGWTGWGAGRASVTDCGGGDPSVRGREITHRVKVRAVASDFWVQILILYK